MKQKERGKRGRGGAGRQQKPTRFRGGLDGAKKWGGGKVKRCFGGEKGGECMSSPDEGRDKAKVKKR